MTDETSGFDFRERPRTSGGVLLCGACRRVGACRLGVEREHPDDDALRFAVTCGPEHEGGPNVAHGGWTAAVFDDCLGHLPLRHGVLSVTAELTVTFVKPVPVGRPLEIYALLDRREGSRWYLTGEITLPSTGATLARAHGVWVTRDGGHFERHERWLAAQDHAAAAPPPA